ncbi:MAG: YtxH domain-containing protein [Anaerolineales bacterium]|nr:YtxH domain-containing protein [Anaerolineales bacterium]
MKKALNFTLGAILGGILGSVTALLLAPSSGEELLNELESKAKNIQIEIKEAAAKKRVELEKELDQLKKPTSKNAEQ